MLLILLVSINNLIFAGVLFFKIFFIDFFSEFILLYFYSWELTIIIFVYDIQFSFFLFFKIYLARVHHILWLKTII
jgi:hypothetical protein